MYNYMSTVCRQNVCSASCIYDINDIYAYSKIYIYMYTYITINNTYIL